ncbi:MAG: hypothetical protein LH470_11700 [Lysobacter sp.]|nr:hypothetical protein [Lysobacter sp.]
MAGSSSLHCGCTDGDRADVSLNEIFQAVSADNVDRAIDAGLLCWNGCMACAIADGLNASDVERLIATRDARLSALAARARYRARQQRLQLRNEQRDAKRSVVSRTSTASSSLPSAAAAALARAKAKAATRAKP